MILHHLTAAHCVRGIQKNGLTRGALPWSIDRDGNVYLRRGFQWLTANPSFHQQWCFLGALPFPKNAARITVAIPAQHLPRLIRWLDLVKRHNPDSAEELNRTGGDVENWYLYAGRIPPAWIIETARNLGELSTPTEAIPMG